MISLFLYFAFSETINDLVPPFLEDLNGNIGTWSFAGSVMIMKDLIMLTPPVQQKFGCAWTRAEISENWAAKFNFRVHKGTGGGGLGIWLIDQYGSYGELHGGPATFKGLLVSITVRDNNDDNNTHSLVFHVVENMGGEQINVSLLVADYEMQFHHRFDIPLHIGIENGDISIYCSGENEEEPPLIIKKHINISLQQKFLGITAASEEMTSRVDLNYIKFVDGVGSKLIKENVHLNKKVITGNLPNSKPSLYRNPIFVKMSQETATLKHGNIKTRANTFEQVLDIIDEINGATYDIASFKELNNFITSSILPYCQKWHRRTIKITDNIREARSIMNTASNYTQQLLENFNSTLSHTIFKTSVSVSKLEQELLQSVNPDNGDVSSTIVIDLSADVGGIESILPWIFGIEVVCVIIYLSIKK